MEDRAVTLDELQRQQGAWSSRTFPHQTPASNVCHLREEVEELGRGHEAEEAADCLLLLLNIAHLRGFSLWGAACAKYAQNQARRWGERDANGVVHHER